MRFACVFERGFFTQESALALFDAPCTYDPHEILHGCSGGSIPLPLKNTAKPTPYGAQPKS